MSSSLADRCDMCQVMVTTESGRVAQVSDSSGFRRERSHCSGGLSWPYDQHGVAQPPLSCWTTMDAEVAGTMNPPFMPVNVIPVPRTQLPRTSRSA